MEDANTLNIGTMGFGGKATLIGCKIAAQNRLPASFFVSVAYDCWAFRRQGVVLDAATGAIKRWLYKDDSPVLKMAVREGISLTGRERTLTTPISESTIRSLKVGDVVLISGRMFTGRDSIHAYLMDHDAPVDLRGQVLDHCGPVVVKENGKWRINGAGPTTSSREEPYQAEIIRKFGLRAVVGKGGMGAKTLAALKEYGAVYLNAIGGAAQVRFALHRGGRGGGSSGLRRSRGNVAFAGKKLSRDRDDGRQRKQSPCRNRTGFRKGA